MFSRGADNEIGVGEAFGVEIVLKCLPIEGAWIFFTGCERLYIALCRVDDFGSGAIIDCEGEMGFVEVGCVFYCFV